MAARNRPRNGLSKDDGSDAHEERTMWNSIVNDLRKLKTLHARAAEVAKQQVELDERIAKGKSFPVFKTLFYHSLFISKKIWEMCGISISLRTHGRPAKSSKQ